MKINVFNFVITEIMTQKDFNQQLELVIYFSFKILSAKYNYKIYNKELLIIIRVFEE